MRKISFLKTLILGLGMLTINLQHVNAQTEKFGKISEDELKMKVYDKDTSAEAVVLFDVGRTYYVFNQESGFRMVFERHTRIKVFKKTGYDYANIEIPYYEESTGTDKEEISGLKAYTYQLKEGKIEKYKLEKDAIFDEKVNKYWKNQKFTMPNISEGCVFEFEYKIYSDFISNIRDWYFQDNIPVVWSEYQVEMPEYYRFKKFSQGHEPIQADPPTTKSGKLNFSGFERNTQGNVTQSSAYNEAVDYQIFVERWYTKDIPAFRSEKMITTPKDYLAQVQYQMESVQYPRSTVKNISRSWDKIVKNLMEWESFGKELNRKGQVKDLVTILSGSPQEKISKAYQYVASNIKWNQRLFHRCWD
jgi:hypothetical protein